MTILNVGTFPPKQCGIATFSMDLKKSLEINKNEVKVVAVSDHNYIYDYGDEVIFNIRQQEKQDYLKAASLVNASPDIDIVIIQHEYGIFGGENGNYILEFANKLDKPYIVVTHTVLPEPKKQQLKTLHQLGSQAAAIVCMTEQSKQLLSDLYDISPLLINVICHGVPEFKKQAALSLKKKYLLADKIIISTFGLIGPGKGLELGIRAMAEVVQDFPQATYLILGQTHPMLKKLEGEKYREMLKDLIKELKISENVKFVNKFLSDEELGEYLYLTDIYLSPYPNKDQAVSGTLTFAIGCGRAIVATSYAYAREVLRDNRGLLSATADPHELAKQIKRILSDPELKNTLQKNAYELGKTWTWPSIGKQYTDLIKSIINENKLQEEKKLNYAGL